MLVAVIELSLAGVRVAKNATLEDSLLAGLRPGITPKELISSVRARHPEATKKEIIHAAFSALIQVAEQDPQKAKALQDFALKGRV